MTKIDRHGLAIGLERTGKDYYLYLKPVGKLTHDDYKVITPMLDDALAAVTDPSIRALVDASEFEGWEARAAWDDFRLGMKHGREFTRLAVVGNKGWHELMTRVGAWFMSGEMRYFEDADAARAWLKD